MRRRRFVAAVIAGLTVVPALSTRAQTPAARFEARSVALVRYRADDDSGIRSIVSRVSLWTDEESAATFQEFVVGKAGSDLPEGEFYESEPVEWSVPGLPEYVTPAAMEWHTTIGFAAYRTEWGLYTMRRDAMVWDIWIGGAERGQVRDVAVTMLAAPLGYLAPDCWSGEAADFLPRADVIPDGLERIEGEVADDDLDFPVVPSIATPNPAATPAVAGCGDPASRGQTISSSPMRGGHS